MKAKLEKIITGKTTKTQIIKALKTNNIDFIDDSESYPNIKINDKKDVLRIYKPYNQKNFVVQVLKSVNMTYSGIPTFEPSGKKSF